VAVRSKARRFADRTHLVAERVLGGSQVHVERNEDESDDAERQVDDEETAPVSVGEGA
jgi:hypothetical protein